eukprot:436382-Pelagomonas_calceolata.AAC.7
MCKGQHTWAQRMCPSQKCKRQHKPVINYSQEIHTFKRSGCHCFHDRAAKGLNKSGTHLGATILSIRKVRILPRLIITVLHEPCVDTVLNDLAHVLALQLSDLHGGIKLQGNVKDAARKKARKSIPLVGKDTMEHSSQDTAAHTSLVRAPVAPWPMKKSFYQWLGITQTDARRLGKKTPCLCSRASIASLHPCTGSSSWQTSSNSLITYPHGHHAKNTLDKVSGVKPTFCLSATTASSCSRACSSWMRFLRIKFLASDN